MFHNIPPRVARESRIARSGQSRLSGEGVRPTARLSRFYTAALSNYWSLRGESKPPYSRRPHNGEGGMRVRFNARSCGRCGGTGRYHYAIGGAATAGRCYSCSGSGSLMSPTTRRHALAFAAWRDELCPTIDEVLSALESGRFGRAWQLDSQPIDR